MSVCAKKDFDYIDEETQNGYSVFVMREVLVDKILKTFNIVTLARVAKLLFGWDCQVIKFTDDDGFGIAFPKEFDKVQEHLAQMTMEKFR